MQQLVCYVTTQEESSMGVDAQALELFGLLEV